MLKHFVS